MSIKCPNENCEEYLRPEENYKCPNKSCFYSVNLFISQEPKHLSKDHKSIHKEVLYGGIENRYYVLKYKSLINSSIFEKVNKYFYHVEKKSAEETLSISNKLLEVLFKYIIKHRLEVEPQSTLFDNMKECSKVVPSELLSKLHTIRKLRNDTLHDNDKGTIITLNHKKNAINSIHEFCIWIFKDTNYLESKETINLSDDKELPIVIKYRTNVYTLSNLIIMMILYLVTFTPAVLSLFYSLNENIYLAIYLSILSVLFLLVTEVYFYKHTTKQYHSDRYPKVKLYQLGILILFMVVYTLMISMDSVTNVIYYIIPSGLIGYKIFDQRIHYYSNLIFSTVRILRFIALYYVFIQFNGLIMDLL